MWSHLGFTPRGEQPGRGKNPGVLTQWWRDHGHFDLLRWDGGSGDRVPVVIDANTFIDLHAGKESSRSLETSRALTAQLAEHVDLLVTPELLVELNRNPQSSERTRLMSIANSYPVVPVNRPLLDSALATLAGNGSARQLRSQDLSDINHIAYAVAAGLEFLVTRDHVVRKRFRDIAADLGLKVVSPGELVTLATQSDDQAVYWPAALHGSGFRIVAPQGIDLDSIDHLRAVHSKERKAALRARVEQVLLAGAEGHIVLLTDADGSPVGAVGLTLEGGTLTASLLRVAQGPLGYTIARFLVSQLRAAAPKRIVVNLHCNDPHMSPAVHSALVSQGFSPRDGEYRAIAVKGCMPAHRVADVVRKEMIGADADGKLAWAISQLDPDSGANPSARDLLSAEMLLAPLTIMDERIDGWSLPIRPHFAYELLGHGMELFPRQDSLGLSVEHAYYSASPQLPPAASRVLWYVSGASEARYVAQSIVVESGRLPWKDAYRKNRRLGVYSHSEVQRTADSAGTVGYVVFGHTRLLANPVNLARAKRFTSESGASMFLQGPWRMPPKLTAQILEAGHDGTR